MRVLAVTMLAAGWVTLWSPAADACSIRGRYCGYPTWAANAFEGRHGRAPVYAIYPGEQTRKTAPSRARRR